MIIPLIFIFLSCHEKAHDNKEFCHENSNFAVNHKSHPVKWNPGDKSFMLLTTNCCFIFTFSEAANKGVL